MYTIGFFDKSQRIFIFTINPKYKAISDTLVYFRTSSRELVE